MKAKRSQFPVQLMSRVLGVSCSGFYAYLARPISARQQGDEALKPHIQAAFDRNRELYGSPRIHRELQEQGMRHGRKRVERLMQEMGLKARIPRRFRCTTESDPEHSVVENTLDRRFEVGKKNRVWAGDLTQIRTDQGWLYLAVVLDLGSRRVVGWSMANHMRTELVEDALRMALGNRRPKRGLLHHSDRGSQYTSESYRELLKKSGLKCSMSRRGECYDNAVVESFFGTLKKELLYRRSWPSRRKARSAIHEYIEVFYNRRRRHSSLGYLSPAEFEQQTQVTKVA